MALGRPKVALILTDDERVRLDSLAHRSRTAPHVARRARILGQSDIKTAQRYLNITDEEMRKALTCVWERRRQLKAVGE
jgi:hypothetical protein